MYTQASILKVKYYKKLLRIIIIVKKFFSRNNISKGEYIDYFNTESLISQNVSQNYNNSEEFFFLQTI